jgi:hypothetical protein
MSVGGWFVDRFDVSWVLAAGFVMWSLAIAATALLTLNASAGSAQVDFAKSKSGSYGNRQKSLVVVA